MDRRDRLQETGENSSQWRGREPGEIQDVFLVFGRTLLFKYCLTGGQFSLHNRPSTGHLPREPPRAPSLRPCQSNLPHKLNRVNTPNNNPYNQLSNDRNKETLSTRPTNSPFLTSSLPTYQLYESTMSINNKISNESIQSFLNVTPTAVIPQHYRNVIVQLNNNIKKLSCGDRPPTYVG